MKTQTFHLELITPCFCAGADQSRAEIRAPSIRGQLRWWFRALGGTPSQEAAAFGSASGEGGRSSPLQIRSAVTAAAAPWQPPKVDPNSPSAYVYYFASVSGKQKGRPGPGPRWTPRGNIPPGSAIEVQLRWTRQVSREAERQLQTALELWLCLGGMGMRVTRGLGAFQCREYPLTRERLHRLEEALRSAHFEFRIWKRDLRDWSQAINEAGRVLKERLRRRFPAGKKGNLQTPLGSSQPRQTSAVYLRPVKFENGSYGLVLFEAPAKRVLGARSRQDAPALKALD